MAIAGNWKAQQQVNYAATNWGNGWNPVHAVPAGAGRQTAPYGTDTLVDPGLVDDFAVNPDGYTEEDSASTLWGYGTETGTSDRPSYGTETSDGTRAAVTQDFPSYGKRQGGVPGGTALRSLRRGATASLTSKLAQPDALATGQPFKQYGEVNEPGEDTSPDSYEMQTSMRQLRTSRSGSQSAGRGNEARASIASRVPGMKIPVYSDEYRHAEMTPKSQDAIIRPFYVRTAGTGRREEMLPNEMYRSTPIQRVPNSDPYQGGEVPDNADYGNYVGEDVLPYV